MVKSKIQNSELYEKMVVSEKEALTTQEDLLNGIKDWWSKILDKEIADTTKIILAAGGYIQIRTTKIFDEKELQKFLKEFNFNQTWFKEEEMTDYRMVETVSVTVYEYGFIPADIERIIGDNQVNLKGGVV